MKKPTAAANPASIVTDAFEKLVYAFTEGVRSKDGIIAAYDLEARDGLGIRFTVDFSPFAHNDNCAPGFFDIRASLLRGLLASAFGAADLKSQIIAVPDPGFEDRVMNFPKVTTIVPIDSITYEEKAPAAQIAHKESAGVAKKIDALRLRLAAANMTNEKITPAFSEKCVKRYSLSSDELAKVTRMARAVKAPQQKR